MKQLCKLMAGAIGGLFILAACSEQNSNYPKEYLGFEKTVVDYSFNRSNETEEFDIKIVAAEKSNEDREVLINGITMPGHNTVFSIKNKTVVIPAKKKSANLRVTIYPKRIQKFEEFRIVCTPRSKEAKKTQITVRLTPK